VIRKPTIRMWSNVFSKYGMPLVLLLLCSYFSIVTWGPQYPTGEAAATSLSEFILTLPAESQQILIVARNSDEDKLFSQLLWSQLEVAGRHVFQVVNGEPSDARKAIVEAVDQGVALNIIACNETTSRWGVFDQLGEKFPSMKGAQILTPQAYSWSNFLKQDNLLNIANQIAVIAIVAVGMTLVVITGGIDLSVGSIIALSSVVTARLIRDFFGAESASTLGMITGAFAGVIGGALIGIFSGSMVTRFRVPAFIVTLAMMLVASGLAFILAEGQSINQLPDSFVWLGREASLFKLPNAVVLMVIIYGLAHLMMTRTTTGRYIYAVGGNAEAARLSGVPVKRILMIVYSMCGALAGLGGVMMASQLKSGAPTYGGMYELYVIAAVVVGGTSLSGGEGKVFGTLVGALIIAVIQNGMNLTNVESYTQKVVLGSVILAAVLLDRIKRSESR
jgi:ribose transport system permease protein